MMNDEMTRVLLVIGYWSLVIGNWELVVPARLRRSGGRRALFTLSECRRFLSA
jgi:hypothetical protein